MSTVDPLVGLSTQPVGVHPAKPTANLIFKALATLRLVPARNGSPPVIPQPSPDQLRLLNRLAVDPRRPRDG